ncbi:MAG: AAA family ATPase [Pseudomonadota bacterium]
MTSSAALQPELAPIQACTVSRDVQNFELLVVDMEVELGESWGDLSFEDAGAFLDQPEATHLEFLAIAVDEEDEKELETIGELIGNAKRKQIKVILIADEVSPIALHQLLRLGADDFVPYPLPDGALREAIERIRKPAPVAIANNPDGTASVTAPSGLNGTIIPVHGLAGGTGATTFAVNLAWELANVEKKDGPRVCLIDLDLQFGTVSTYLDLPRRETVFEVLSDTASMDSEAFNQAILTFNERLSVFTAPSDMLPLDIISPEDVGRVVEMARTQYDFVVVDMPSTLVQWTETLLNAAHIYFAVIELDMRSAQNALRLVRAMKGEDLPFEKLRYVLNRAPKFTDLTGKSRVKRMAESLDIDIEVQLPDGGRQVLEAGDHGLPLAETAGKNPFRKELAKLAKSIYELNQAEATA